MVFRYLWCFVALMAISASFQQSVTPQPSCSTTDVNSNKNAQVLKWLKSQGVTIYETPVKVEENVCGGELKTNGACCELKSVRNLIGKSNQMMIFKWRNYVGKLARIKNRFMNGLKKVSKMMNSKEVKARREKCKSDHRNYAKFANVDAMLPDQDRDVESMKKFIENFQEQIKMFKTQGKICFNAMRNIRANLMCTACSANAGSMTATQTSTDAVFNIDYNSCSGLVAKCFPIWKFNFQLTSMMQYVQMSIMSKKGDKAGTKWKSDKYMSPTDLEQVKEIFSRCELKSLTDNTITCNTTGATSTVEDYNKLLCGKLFSMNKENGYVEGDETIDADVEDKDITDAEATAGTVQRLLQTTVSDQSNFNVGVQVSSGSGASTNLLSDNSGLVPTESVETGIAGDSTSSSALKLTITLGLSLASLLAVI